MEKNFEFKKPHAVGAGRITKTMEKKQCSCVAFIKEPGTFTKILEAVPLQTMSKIDVVCGQVGCQFIYKISFKMVSGGARRVPQRDIPVITIDD